MTTTGAANLPGVGHDSFAPKAESYLPAPTFKFSPNQREIDFAQYVACGGDIVEALSISSMVTSAEAKTAGRPKLYAMATRLLSNPAVQERLDYYTILHKASMNVSVERLQQELSAVSYSDFAAAYYSEDGPMVMRPNQFYDSDTPGSKEFYEEPEWSAGDPIRNPHHIPRHIRAAIKEYFIDKDGIVKIKFHDKLKSIRMLGDLEGHFDEANRAKAPQVNISIGDGMGSKSAPERDVIDITPEPDRPELDCLK